ncbi:hypothetical protein PN836_011250 [Ningiella sp. W23]|uniref:hypothetical protein n=1 Tax=Ningiella sp. W23 TaxID=3023715 RepID=UPI00375707EC
MAKSEVDKLLSKHPALIHSENLKVMSHVQREEDEWHINTLTIEGYDVPFKYKRKKVYRNLKGARVNLTYYPVTEEVAGLAFEVMKVIRVRVA